MRLFSRAALGASLLAAGLSAQATTVTSQATWMVGQQWRLSFSIDNDTLPEPIEGWTVYFDAALFSDIADASAPAGWDPLLWQPEAAFASPGAFDLLADPGAELQPGQALGGFSVLVTWLGVGAPAALPFEVYRLDPDSGEVVLVEGGRTRVAAVPLPATLLLTLAGLALMAGLRQTPHRSNRLAGAAA